MQLYKYSKLVVVLLIIFFGCSTSTKIKKTEIDQNPMPAWEESDSEQIADSLIKKLLGSDWSVNNFKMKKPIVVVGKINTKDNNKTDVKILEKDVERSLINSGEISFIASKEKREEIRYDRKNSSSFANSNEFNKYLKSLNSDFFLEGNFDVRVDSTVLPMKMEYELTLDMINTKDAASVWKSSSSIIK